MESNCIYNLHCLAGLAQLPDESINCCVTSPPYYGLRDYGTEGQLGLEKTPEEYVANLVAVFREVRRVLRDDGTVWLNLGDSYMSSKQLVGIPWRVAFALQADGWWLRQDIIWHKPNPMPESVTDRCTKAHEYIFLLSKSARYFYDAEAVKEEQSPTSHPGTYRNTHKLEQMKNGGSQSFIPGKSVQPIDGKRNRRSVWTVATQPYSGAHFATFPPKLIEPCILAGCPVDGVVLDPFMGAGTTALVALKYGRRHIGFELNKEYCEMAQKRIMADVPLLNHTGSAWKVMEVRE